MSATLHMLKAIGREVGQATSKTCSRNRLDDAHQPGDFIRHFKSVSCLFVSARSNPSRSTARPEFVMQMCLVNRGQVDLP